jgi:hypothetical protein
MTDSKNQPVPEFDIETDNAAIILETEETPVLDFTKVISNGREVHWRKDGETWICHNGDGREVSATSWDRFQLYLDGVSGFPG